MTSNQNIQVQQITTTEKTNTPPQKKEKKSLRKNWEKVTNRIRRDPQTSTAQAERFLGWRVRMMN